MARKRRRFTADFKKRVALEALRERDTVQAIAARHEVHPNQVSAWKRQAVEGLDEVFSPGSKRGGEHEATIRDLHGRPRRRARHRIVVQLLRRVAPSFVAVWPDARRSLPGRLGGGRVSRPGTMRAGNATPLAASSRCAAPPLRSGPPVTRRVPLRRGWRRPAFLTTRPRRSDDGVDNAHPLRQISFIEGPNQSEYTVIPPSDCPTN